MKTKLLSVAVYLCLIFFVQSSYAWGEIGHSLVAEVAFKNLDKKTQKIVLEYLNGMTIEEAANWMDKIKNDHAYDKLKPLHYVNFDQGQEVTNTCCDNIIWTLTNTINELKNYKSLSKEEVKTKLCYLFHLMGDLHQPLHVGYGSDKGGNTYQVQFHGKGTNLHGLFDYGIIEKQNISLKQCLKAKQYSKLDLQQIKNGNPLSWAKESRSYLNDIYDTNGPTITEEYEERNAQIIKEQIFKAGIRLSEVLKDTFEK
ncbi:S1/P1 nuclease [Flavobacterium sp. SUN046]|uniref:S1/P1 nuclease n=1 Tax=Flavobacterium sp. SUN046 TaxID=3002440 RepID=UPI002DB86550|nr:S1/P1 nuclease [Flavobacterium sp. SUN046]MEC4048547.1 S1/P1 nuclease [Flavobacterium sp. SUN046]